MINKFFNDTFNFLVSSLNNLSKEKSSNHTFPTGKESDHLKRMLNSIIFITSNKESFSANLKNMQSELEQLKKDCEKLTSQIGLVTKNSILFTINNLIDGLILEVNSEIEKREIKIREFEEQQNTKSKAKSKDAIKVKMFKSAFAEEVEKQMNDFLGNNDIEIRSTLQSVENNIVCITIFYKIK